MKRFFNFFKKNKEKNLDPSTVDNTKDMTSIEVIEKYKAEMKNIKIENQPFRLSGLLHILTNRVSKLLQDNRHTIYYDVENEVGRYIIGDNDYIEQVLEILVKDALSLNSDFEVMLKISKYKNKFLVFEVINEKGFIKKALYHKYVNAERIMTSQSKNLNSFIKAKKIVEAMRGTTELKSGRMSGTHYTFKIPYFEDKDNRSNQEELKKFLAGKKALFIGKDKYNTKRAQYIFKTYGINIENMKLDDFEKKRPKLHDYDMVILRSSDLTYKHASAFKNINQDKNSNFKIIIVHELFENEEKMALSKSIAHAELYNPTVIGDVEEILHQIFILKSKAVKGISNMETFNVNAFTIKGGNPSGKGDLEQYKGAHIAIVEDSKVDEKIIRNILTIGGVTIFCMHNGAEMLDLLEEKEIDIIFTDVNMPVMDGLLMTKKIRAVKKWKNIPIISISSMAFPHEIKEMQVAGMNAAIPKPIQAKEVYAALGKFLIMTDKIRNRKVNENKTHFSFNKEVLDIDRGLKEAKSDLLYRENLLDTMEMLRSTKDPFEKMIYNQESHALTKYAQETLRLYEKIHAPEMIKMFNDLIDFLSQNKKTYLIDYVYMYQKNCKKLEKEVAQYIDNIQNRT